MITIRILLALWTIIITYIGDVATVRGKILEG